MINLYLDDIRDPKTDRDWTVVRDPQHAMNLLRTGLVEEISFDHDLGEDALTGYDVAKYIEELVVQNKIKCPRWNIHSANPVGAKNIKLAMEFAEKA